MTNAIANTYATRCCVKVIMFDTVWRLSTSVQIIYPWYVVGYNIWCRCCFDHAGSKTSAVCSGQNAEEQRAVTAFWWIHAIERCRVDFLPIFVFLKSPSLMYTNSESPSAWKNLRSNCGICCATITDAKVSHIVSKWKMHPQTLSMNVCASSSILAGRGESDEEVE